MPYDISGTITLDGAAFEGVRVEAFESDEVAGYDDTDASGNYTIADLTDALTYTVKPRYPVYEFTPTSTNVTLASANETDVDFSGDTINFAQYRMPGTGEVEWVLNGRPTFRTVYRGSTTASELQGLEPGFAGVVGDPIVFGGTVSSVERRLLGGRTDTVEVAIEVTGWEQILHRRTITIPVSTPTVNSLLTDIQTDVLNDEGIALGTVDGGTTTMSYADYSKSPVADVLDSIAEAVDGYWYIDPWPMELNVRQFGEVSAPWALSTSVAVRNIVARQHRENYFNVLYVDNGSLVISDTTQTEVDDRAFAEGGTGRYERVMAVDDGYSQSDMENHAAVILPQHDDMAWEVSYTAEDASGLSVGMDQTINLQSELTIPTGTTGRVERIVRRNLPSGEVEWDVTLQTVNRGNWERLWDQAWRMGSFGTPRYWRP